MPNLGQVGSADLLYKPIDVGGKLEWTVYVRRPDWTAMQVYIARTGEPKRLKVANALISDHQGHYPDATEVVVPVLSLGADAAVDQE
ncbi:hypothetical protein [Roseitranquillus sediminis]|uniref:hypothetical protein n=1 Tax=Roseitranquillus sediminis TaxID=2809051 RepID=UPI001D0CC72E|nr:hypothetical protein [Roseitranquillus sediminis]MBM9595045.1 hypothetical protein [Roseitranquillus sediminis]